MIILFAPAKTFKEGNISSNTNLRFNETNKLIDIVKTWDKDTYINNFMISDSVYNEVKSYYDNFYVNPSYEAFTMFIGQSYIGLDYESLDVESKKYIQDKVYVIDALYGIIKPNDAIKMYRLDFTVKNLNLKKIWKERINDYFDNIQDKEILSLSSTEFSSILSKDKTVYNISFVNIVNGKKKKISVFNKQMRGKLLRYLSQNKINCVDELPLIFEGYKLYKEGYELIYEEICE